MQWPREKSQKVCPKSNGVCPFLIKHVAASEKNTQNPKDRPNAIGKFAGAQRGEKTGASFLSHTFASRQRCQKELIVLESVLIGEDVAASGDLL
jgi:hypothetical protein